jgi:hypothetical protein
MSEVKFTEEELAMLDGKDVEDDEEPLLSAPESEEEGVVSEEAEAEEPAEEPAVVAETTEELDYKAEYEKQRKANAGLLNELVGTRRKWSADKEWRSAVEQRMELLTEKIAAPVQEEAARDQEPDRDEDPVEWLAWKQKQEIESALEPVKEQEYAAEQERQYGELIAQAGRAAVEAEEHFLASTNMDREDYSTKLDELRYDRIKWYAASKVPIQDAMAIVEEEERQFVVNSLAEGLNPAAEIVRMHEAVKPGKIPTQEPKQEVAAPKEGVKPVMNKVTAAKQGLSEGGLQNVSGSGSAGGTITAEQFADMDPDDPIFQKIAGNETLFARLNIHGSVSI